MRSTKLNSLGWPTVTCHFDLIDRQFINSLSMHFQAFHKHRQRVDYHNHNKNHKAHFFQESQENVGGRGTESSVGQAFLGWIVLRLRHKGKLWLILNAQFQDFTFWLSALANTAVREEQHSKTFVYRG